LRNKKRMRNGNPSLEGNITLWQKITVQF
jgi:hypothetical protein